MDRFKKYIIKSWNSAAIVSQAPISRLVWYHLLLVYCTLGCSLIFALFGAYSQLFLDIGGWTTAVGFIGSLYWMSKINPWKEQGRVIIFLLASYLLGSTMGPTINLIIKVDQGYLIKIIMGAIVFFTCQFTAAIQTLDRNIIYQIGEFSSPIFITAWMILYEFYPGFLPYALFLLLQPFPWSLVMFLLPHIRYTLQLWCNFPIHIAWITFLCYCFNYPFLHLMFVYIFVLGILLHMRVYMQEVLYAVARNTDESYYLNTAITFYTEFLARTVSIVIQFARFVVRVIRRYLRL